MNKVYIEQIKRLEANIKELMEFNQTKRTSFITYTRDIHESRSTSKQEKRKSQTSPGKRDFLFTYTSPIVPLINRLEDATPVVEQAEASEGQRNKEKI